MAKKTIKKIIYCLLNFISAGARLIVRVPRVSILMYHSIGDNQAFSTVSARDFTRQLKYLKKHEYRVISLAELVGNLKNGGKLNDKTVALTFDDGYMDNFSTAWPLLKKYDFPATIFLSTDHIGRHFTNSEGVEIKMMGQEQIKEMAGSGRADFGSHTHTHPRLDNIGLADFAEEARLSKEIIEKITDKECCFFAYPRGCFKNDFFAILKGLGFEAAFSVREGLIGGNDDLFFLKRNLIYRSGGFSQFKGKLGYSVAIYNWLKGGI